MKRVNFRLFALAIALVATSCVKDVVVDSNFHGTPTEKICFGAELKDTGEDTRGGVASNRVGKHDLKSADGEFVLPMGVYVEDGIGCADAAETRGVKLEDGSSIESFTVWAKHEEGENVSAYFNNVGYKKNTADNVFYSTGEEYMWPGVGKLTFVAVTNAPESGFVPNYTAGSDGENMLESFTYTVPADATAQEDIVLAKATYNGDTDRSAPLTFSHIMSAVQVKIGTMPSTGGTIKSMTFRNIYNSGTYDYETDTWSRAGTKADFPVLSNGNASFTPGNTGSIVNADDYTLMMLPQTLADDAVLEIVFQYSGASEVTLTASIAKDKDGAYYAWQKGKTTYYTISIDENYNLQVIPQGNVLDAHYIMTTANVNVTKIDEGQEWYLKVSADNVTSTENISVKVNDGTINQYINDGYWINAIDGNIVNARGSDIVKGEGTGITNVIIFIPENITAQDRKITLEYGIVGQESNAKFEYLYQKCPYWDTTNKWGWEKVDDGNKGTYGFEWTRKVCYITSYKVGSVSSSLLDTYSKSEVQDMVNTLISQYNAGDYVSMSTFDHYSKNGNGDWINSGWDGWTPISNGSRMAVIIDYSKVNLDAASSLTNGLNNTKAFFNAGAVMQFEQALKAIAKKNNSDQKFFRNLRDDEIESGKFFFDSYEYVDENGQTTKKMFIEFGDQDDASGILKYIIMRNAYDVVSKDLLDGHTTTMLDMNATKIKWYLPAVNQFVNMENFEFATGNATFTSSDFWSSTAAPNNQAYTGEGVAIDRSNERKVIVQRVVTEIPQPTTISEIDTEEMAGGENGEAQWVE